MRPFRKTKIRHGHGSGARPETLGTQAEPFLTNGFNCLRRCRYDLMFYNRHDIYVGRSLGLYGKYSQFELYLFRRVIRPVLYVENND